MENVGRGTNGSSRRHNRGSSDDPIALKSKPPKRDGEQRIRLPKDAPKVPQNEVKAHHSPYPVGSSAASKPLPRASDSTNRPTRVAHDTLSSVSSSNFYGPSPSSKSKYFVRDGADPSSFFNNRGNAYQVPLAQEPEPPESPPQSKRMPDIARHVDPYKRTLPHTVPNEPIDLVSESEEDEAGPSIMGPSKPANPPGRCAAEQTHPASSGQMASSSRTRHSSPPPSRDADMRYYHSKSRSSSTESMVGTRDMDDPIEDYADESRKNRMNMNTVVSTSGVRAFPKQPRARMQDRNGVVPDQTEVRRNPSHQPITKRSLGEVKAYRFNGQDCWTKPLDLQLRSDNLLYGEKSFPINDMTFLVATNAAEIKLVIGFVFQAVRQGSRLETHHFTVEIRDSGAAGGKQACQEMMSRAKQGGLNIQVVTRGANIAAILNINKDAQEEALRDSPISTSQQRLDFSRHSTRDETDSRTTSRASGHAGKSGLTGMRRSGRSTVVEQRADREMMAEKMARRPEKPEKVLCRWPPTGRQELAITAADYYRLYGDEFLNDTLIDFGLRYVVENQLGQKSTAKSSAATQTNVLDGLCPDDVHVFNPFFYKKLATKVKVNRPANSAPNEPYPDWPAYESVRKWTNKVDIFQKKFLIVPVNENLHWYMAVIYNPGVVLEDPRFLRGTTPMIDPIRPATRRAGREEEEQNVAMVQDSFAEPILPSGRDDGANMHSKAEPMLMETDPMVDATPRELAPDSQLLDMAVSSAQLPNDTASPLMEVMGTSLSEAAPVALVSRTQTEIDEANEAMAVDNVEEPASPIDTTRIEPVLEDRGLIMTFDSLSATHAAVSNVLNRWLAYEARDKKDGIELSWNNRQRPLPYKSVIVPSQRNFSDCGIYCLHNVEVLLSQPHEMMSFIFKSTLKKEQLDGEKLDHTTQWQGDVALDGRAKWRSIIDSLSDQPIGGSEPAAVPAQDILLEASQASSVEVLSAREAPSEPSEPGPANEPPRFDPSNPSGFLLVVQARNVQQPKTSPQSVSACVEEQQTTDPMPYMQRPSEELSASVISSTVATEGTSTILGMVDHRRELVELEGQGDTKTDEMDDAVSNTVEIGPAVPLGVPDGHLRLPDTQGYDTVVSEEDEILEVQPAKKDISRMREQGSTKKSKARVTHVEKDPQARQLRNRSSYDHRDVRSNPRAASTAKSNSKTITLSPLAQKIMDDTAPAPSVSRNNPTTGSKRKSDNSDATSPQGTLRPTPKRRRQKTGDRQEEPIAVDD